MVIGSFVMVILGRQVLGWAPHLPIFLRPAQNRQALRRGLP
jgi:hypothetical protein